MNKPEILDAPDLNLTPRDARLAEWEAERRAFYELLPTLLDRHRGQFVAIHQGRVVATGADEVEAARAAYRQCGYVPIHVDLVTDAPRPPARIPSPRLPHPARTPGQDE